MMQRQKNWLRRVLAGLAVLVLLLSALPVAQVFYHRLRTAFSLGPILRQEQAFPLNLYFLDVGKADALVLECGGEYALVDAGTYADGEAVEAALKKLGVSGLKMLFATHPDSDHIGGMGQVLQSFPVETLVVSDIPAALLPATDEYALLKGAMLEKGVEPFVAKAGDRFRLGEAEITVLGPVGEHADINNYSLVLKVVLGEFSALLVGDAEIRAEQMLMDAGADISADVLKVGHHGSNTSSGAEFLRAVNAAYAVVSTGPDGNRLPRKEVLQRLEAAGMEIHRTDTDGTVLVSSDGTETVIKTER